jgi:hypothetical protein
MMSHSKLADDTISVFRSAAALSSTEPAQLRRTIEELTERIHSQDLLIDEQGLAITEMERENSKLQVELDRLYGLISDLEGKASLEKDVQDGYKNYVQFQNLKVAYDEQCYRLEELADTFQSIVEAVVSNVEAALEALDQLPATDQTAALHKRAKNEVQAIMKAKKARQISPANTLRLLSEVEHNIISFITARPALTFKRAEGYRAQILIETLYRDSKTKAINTPEAAKILATAEQKTIKTMQARRAMAWAARVHPDKVVLNKRGLGAGKSWRLSKTNDREGRS